MRRLLFFLASYLCLPAVCQDILPQQELHGRALSDFVYEKISGASIFSVSPNDTSGEPAAAFLAKEEIADVGGFFYNIKIGLPLDMSIEKQPSDPLDEAKQILVVIPQEDAVYFIDNIIAAVEHVASERKKTGISFLLTAGDMSMFTDAIPLGSATYIAETEERIENIFVLVLCNDQNAETPRLLSYTARKIKSPPVFEKALSLPRYTGFFLPRYKNLDEFAENGIPCAGIIYDKNDRYATDAVFESLEFFFENFSGMSENDYAEKNYTSANIKLFGKRFFLSERKFIFIYIFVAAIIIFLSLLFNNFFIWLSALNLFFFGAQDIFLLLGFSIFYAASVIVFIKFKKLPFVTKFIPVFLPDIMLLTLFLFNNFLPVFTVTHNANIEETATITDKEYATISYEQTDFFEFNALHITVNSPLQLVRCTIMINTQDSGAVFNSLMPFSVESAGVGGRQSMRFNIPEYPPDPLEFEVYYHAQEHSQKSVKSAIESAIESIIAEFYIFDSAENAVLKQKQKIAFNENAK